MTVRFYALITRLDRGDCLVTSYTVRSQTRWTKRKGLEGPFQYLNGRVLYYDPRAGQYWDPSTDFYVDEEELQILNQMTLDCLHKS